MVICIYLRPICPFDAVILCSKQQPHLMLEYSLNI